MKVAKGCSGGLDRKTNGDELSNRTIVGPAAGILPVEAVSLRFVINIQSVPAELERQGLRLIDVFKKGG